MNVLIQKHRVHPIWKFYDENKLYLGQILGDSKENMPILAKKMIAVLEGKSLEGYKKDVLPDGSIDIYEIKSKKRVAGFEGWKKDNFLTLAKTIQNDITKITK